MSEKLSTDDIESSTRKFPEGYWVCRVCNEDLGWEFPRRHELTDCLMRLLRRIETLESRLDREMK